MGLGGLGFGKTRIPHPEKNLLVSGLCPVGAIGINRAVDPEASVSLVDLDRFRENPSVNVNLSGRSRYSANPQNIYQQ